MSAQNTDQIRLPDRLVSSADLARLVRELQSIDESLRQSSLRHPTKVATQTVRSSETLEQLTQLNDVKVLDQKQRTQLIELLSALQIHAPRIHMSLAAEPTAAFTYKIVTWMRKNLHPLTLLEIGLQPAIAAGCTIRTDNKFFDMSLRNHFTENRGLLVQKIAEIGEKIESEAFIEAMAKAEPKA